MPDEQGMIWSPMEQNRRVNYPLKKLGLCASLTKRKSQQQQKSIPDSPKVDAEIVLCVGSTICGVDFVTEQ